MPWARTPRTSRWRRPEGEDLESQVWAQLSTCYDPEIPVDIVELGLIYSCDVQDMEGDGDQKRVDVKMTLTAPGCGMARSWSMRSAKSSLALEGVAEVDVDLVFEPQWDKSMMSEEARLKVGLF